ncbi:MAG: hypothetical protein MJ169_00140 [Treponema sp.]|nr:hypothetical protein [Treponema sp.]
MKTFRLITSLILTLLLFSCSNSSKAISFYLEAVKAFESQDLDRALDFTDQSLKKNFNFRQAKILKAKIQFYKKDFEAAEKSFRELYKKNKSDFDLSIWYIKTLIMNQKYESALLLLNNLEKISSQDYRIFYWKAVCYRYLGDFENYFISITKSENYIYDAAYIYLDLSSLYADLGLKEKSENYLNKYNTLKKDK